MLRVRLVVAEGPLLPERRTRQRLDGDHVGPDDRFVFDSGEGDDRIAGLSAGADDYLSKPFEPHPLFASFIQAAAAQSRLV